MAAWIGGRAAALLCIWGAGMAMTAAPRAPATITCTAIGAKLFSPPLTAEAVCHRFVTALGKAGDGLTVELRFQPRGRAAASVRRAGQAPMVQELAVADRGFTPADIDRLAGDVARAMAAKR